MMTTFKNYAATVLLACIAVCSAFAQITPDLQSKLNQGVFDDQDVIPVLIRFEAIQTLEGWSNSLSKEEKGQLVYAALTRQADRTQTEVLSYLETTGAAYSSFVVANCVAARLSKEQILRVANYANVVSVQHDNLIPLTDISQAEPLLMARSDSSEYGIRLIGADSLWQEGVTGQGVVVAGQDTGYEWALPQIQGQYRGFDPLSERGDHNYNWHDAIHAPVPATADSLNPCGYSTIVPCDDHNHGTHTMGTMVGVDASTPSFGVAPEAQWIACRNMDRGNGAPSTYIECFDWFLAPTDLSNNEPLPSLAPHVINNSWACTTGEGCNPDNFSLMQEVVNNLRMAGIVVVASAGNSGNSCGSISTPAAIYEGAFTVGASNIRDTIANFSSRGLVVVDSSFRIKPNVVAPGVAVKSMVRDGSYRYWNGTSMAGPHVAGAVALLISAVPELAGNVDAIESLLEESAVHLEGGSSCGLDSLAIPNATYGYGRIDVLGAAQLARSLFSITDSEVQIEKAVTIIPNPVSDYITLPGATARRDYEIYDAIGRKVQVGAVSNSIDVTSLEQGWYLLRLDDGKQGRFIKL